MTDKTIMMRLQMYPCPAQGCFFLNNQVLGQSHAGIMIVKGPLLVLAVSTYFTCVKLNLIPSLS